MMWMTLSVLAVVPTAAVVPAVSELNVTQYIGRWYQMNADRVVKGTFERGALCVTADYTLAEDPTYGTVVKLVNSERVGDVADGELSNVTGMAYAVDPSKPSELSVEFDPPVPSVKGSYWVIALGPVVEGKYQYAVVSDDQSQTLFTLARDVAEYREKYKESVESFLEESGFTGFLHEPIETVQDGCSYAPEPLAAVARNYCPSSPARIHASCDETVAFEDGCSDVIEEILARVEGQHKSWSDPHNNGTYTLLAQSDGKLELERMTSNGKYVDLINFVFADTETGCLAHACSQSQVMSIVDFGTNHCNIFNLFCGSKDDCPVVRHDLAYVETINTCSDAATSCLASRAIA